MKNPEYVSKQQFVVRDVSAEDVQEWVFRKLRDSKDPQNIGALAIESSEYFSSGTMPVRVQIGGIRFSDILRKDSRFEVSSSLVSLRSDES